MTGRYLVEAANLIVSSTGQSMEPSLQVLNTAFATGCKTLQRLEEDPAFREDLDMLAQRESSYFPDRQSILRDLEHFTHGFLQIERKVLENAGTSQVMTSFVLSRATTLRNSCRGDFPRLQTAEVVGYVTSLREAVCAVAEELQSASKTAAKPPSKMRQKLEGLAIGVSGGAVIYMNAGAAATSLGLSAAGSAVSAALGVAFIREGLSHYRK